MKPSLTDLNPNESQDSLNLDDNYNEEETLQQTHKIPKLSIMHDFNQLSHKLNLNPPQKPSESPPQNTLAHYYAKLKLKNQSSPDLNQLPKHQTPNPSHNEPSLETNNRPSPLHPHHIRSSSSNLPITQQTPSHPHSKHERNPSQGEAFKKKIVQQMQINDSKRNYSSVQDKKKILQPSKTTLNTYQNISMKDYFGDQKNVILKKQTIKNLTKDSKIPKDTHLNPQILHKQTTYQKYNKENSIKESNTINSQLKKMESSETQKASKVTTEKETEKMQRPLIVLYKTKIDLSLDPEKLKAMLREEQMKSDYDMSNTSMSSLDEGPLFGNAIERQRTAKTSQTVQSPHFHSNVIQGSRKQQMIQHQKQYISSPISISHSPNPTNMQKSIFQKKEMYR